MDTDKLYPSFVTCFHRKEEIYKLLYEWIIESSVLPDRVFNNIASSFLFADPEFFHDSVSICTSLRHGGFILFLKPSANDVFEYSEGSVYGCIEIPQHPNEEDIRRIIDYRFSIGYPDNFQATCWQFAILPIDRAFCLFVDREAEVAIIGLNDQTSHYRSWHDVSSFPWRKGNDQIAVAIATENEAYIEFTKNLVRMHSYNVVK